MSTNQISTVINSSAETWIYLSIYPKGSCIECLVLTAESVDFKKWVLVGLLRSLGPQQGWLEPPPPSLLLRV